MTTEERKRQLKRRGFAACLIGVGLFAVSTYAGVKYDENHFSLREVQDEIDIHSGIKETPDGHRIDPFMEHGCEVPYDGRNFDERLADKMYEEGYDQKTIESAVEKFQLQCNGELKEAKEINLKKIENEAKKAKHK